MRLNTFLPGCLGAAPQEPGPSTAPGLAAENTAHSNVDTLQSGGRAYVAAPVALPARPSGVAKDFGAPHGTPIANTATVMRDLYRALGHNRPPQVMGIFVEPYNDIVHTDAAGVGLNPFGHAAMAYTMGSTTHLMNISGSSVTPMVNFMSLEDYLFGVNFDNGNEQGSIYNRTFRLICIWDWPAKQVHAMHEFYTHLAARAQRKEARFSQIFSRVFNLRPGKTRWGNCAMWTGQGLVEAGIINRATMWPKQMVIKMLEGMDANNTTCVWLPRVAHAALTFGHGAGHRGMVAPCRCYQNCLYWDLGRRAQATLTVPPGSMVARPYVL